MDADLTQQLLDSTKARILIYEEAIDALVSGKVSSYELDTGQTRSRVTKLNLKDLEDAVDRMMNRCATLNARLNGGSVIGVPGF